MSTAQLLDQEIDIEPTDAGVPLQKEEVEEVEATDEPQEESEELQTADSEETIDDLGDVTIGQFANAAGVSLPEIYGLKLKDGRTLSQAVDESGQKDQVIEELQGTVRQLQEKAMTGPVPQPVSPQAQALFERAKMLQEQYSQTKWAEIDPAQATNLRMDMQDAINQTQQAAYAAQAEHEQKYNQALAQYQQEVSAEIVRRIPEWRVQSVRGEQEAAIDSMLTRDYGFDERAISQAKMDPRAVKLIHDLWAVKREKADIKNGLKKVRKVAKKHMGTAAQQTKSMPKAADVGRQMSQTRNQTQRIKKLLETDFQV